MGRPPILGGPDFGCGDGWCACGCGQLAPIAKMTRQERGQIFGRPIRFIHGHNVTKHGRYPYRHKGHARVHVLVAETALGKPLPKGAVVHHVDGNGHNNDPRNLVVCQDQGYHLLLHQRQRARDACGDPNAIRCHICHEYDRQDDIIAAGRGKTVHRACRSAVNRRYGALRYGKTKAA